MPSGEPEYFIEGMRCAGGKFGLRMPPSLPAVMALGQVMSKQILKTEQWEGYTTLHTRLQFDGMTLELIAFSNDPARYMLASIDIRSPAWARLSPFRVGQPVKDARKLLGPDAQEDTQFKALYAGENESVRFETRANKVSAVIYQCYTG